MIRGLYTSTWGMLKQQEKFDVISNNIANISTNGYKKDLCIDRPFEEVLTRKINDNSIGKDNTIGSMNLGSYIGQILTDFTPGKLIQTNNNTDICISNSNKSFFAIGNYNEDGELIKETYTRNGAFTINNEGYLTNVNGDYVIGNNGPLFVGSDSFVVQGDGSIYANNSYIDTIKVVEFSDTQALRKIGDNQWELMGQAQQQPFSGTIKQGFIEGSNVKSVEEMVSMISLMRSYETNQRLIKAHDDTLNKVINEVGKV